MISTSEAFVWVWTPGATVPVPAGLLRRRGDRYQFAYGTGYLNRRDAISLYGPELPLRPGWIDPPAQMNIASVLRDAGPDSWGQRIILAKLTGSMGPDADTGDVDQLAYFMESGSDRISALDFQERPDEYVLRGADTSLDQMMTAAERIQEGLPISNSLDAALLHGTSVGGARPKALLRDGRRQLIAKFSTSTDIFPTVKAEALGMEFARRVGIDVPASELRSVMGRDVLVIERFDRPETGGRRLMVSALTMLQLAEHEGRYATYPDLLDVLARDGVDSHVGRRLFERIVFNVAIGNTDDHARNHAAFWDGDQLELTPAYDLTPQIRSGETASQALFIDRAGSRDSSFLTCLNAAGIYGLSRKEARDVIDLQIDTIETQWDEVVEMVGLDVNDESMLRHRSVLNPFTRYDY
jgi:serine/threonine-protein kinase HipA